MLKISHKTDKNKECSKSSYLQRKLNNALNKSENFAAIGKVTTMAKNYSLKPKKHPVLIRRKVKEAL